MTPEAAVSGPLAFVKSGDWTDLYVPNRTLTVEISDAELEERRSRWTRPDSIQIAVGAHSTASTCSKPTPARTSTVPQERAATRCRETPTCVRPVRQRSAGTA